MTTPWSLVAGAALLLALTAPAGADPTIELRWSDSALGATGIGTDTLSTNAGDTVELDVLVTVDAAGLQAATLSYRWDQLATDVLDHVGSSASFAWDFALASGAVNQAQGTADSQFGGVSLLAGPSDTTFTLGQLSFSVVSAGTTQVEVGLFNTGVDQLCANPPPLAPCTPYVSPTLLTASITAVPEPGRLTLLASGIGCLAFLRTRRPGGTKGTSA